jgi:L-threonylcarbamoyladenylate synthase
VLLRPGAVTREDIARVLGGAPRDRDADAPRASGTLAAHYAPSTPVRLVPPADLEAQVEAAACRGLRVAVLARSAGPLAAAAVWHQAPADAAGYAHSLYGALRALDANQADRIVVESPPDAPEWEAVLDRLARAAAGAPETDEP